MKVTRSRICLAGLVCAIAFAILPLNAAEERPKEDQLVVIVYPVADLPVWSLGDDKPRFNPEVLIAHIKTAIDPDSWTDAAISPHKSEKMACLVVRQTRANHNQITELIEGLRPQFPGEQRQTIDENGVIHTFPPNPAQPDR